MSYSLQGTYSSSSLRAALDHLLLFCLSRGREEDIKAVEVAASRLAEQEPLCCACGGTGVQRRDPRVPAGLREPVGPDGGSQEAVAVVERLDCRCGHAPDQHVEGGCCLEYPCNCDRFEPPTVTSL